ncbi:MAG: nitroreductase family protein [Erysipelotrichaceae bacterium]|nr:nitroreductase family protein [Erysipelotrichaceae bacterium]
MNVYDAIITRRSTRLYKSEPLDEKLIETIVEAGRMAPSGGNSQKNHFFVITNKELLEKIAGMAKDAFSKMEVYEGMYKSMASAITRAKTGNYVFHYNAPCLIVVANDITYSNNMADCACAMENMMIMASDLNLGSCWINQLKWLNEDPQLLELFRELGLKENERIYASLAIGYPATEDGLPVRNPLPRTGNEVTRIR